MPSASASRSAVGPVRRRCGRDRQRGLAAALGGDIGQRLQQPVHQRAALQGPGARTMRLAGPDAMAFARRRDRMAATGFRRCSPAARVSAAMTAARPARRLRRRRAAPAGGAHPRAASSASPCRRRSRSPRAASRNWRGPCRSDRTRRAGADAVHVAGHAAADDQPVGRARHRHIEQAAIFVLGLAHASPRAPRTPREDLRPSCRPRPRRPAHAAPHCPAADG